MKVMTEYLFVPNRRTYRSACPTLLCHSPLPSMRKSTRLESYSSSSAAGRQLVHIVSLCFKAATIIPVQTKTTVKSLNDYCLVALTSVVVKVLERLTVLTHLKSVTNALCDAALGDSDHLCTHPVRRLHICMHPVRRLQFRV